MAFTPKVVGDWVRVLNSAGDVVQVARVSDTAGSRYVIGGLWFTTAGAGRGSAEDGYTLDDATTEEIATYERMEKLIQLNTFDWSQMSDVDLDLIKAIVDTY